MSETVAARTVGCRLASTKVSRTRALASGMDTNSTPTSNPSPVARILRMTPRACTDPDGRRTMIVGNSMPTKRPSSGEPEKARPRADKSTTGRERSALVNGDSKLTSRSSGSDRTRPPTRCRHTARRVGSAKHMVSPVFSVKAATSDNRVPYDSPRSSQVAPVSRDIEPPSMTRATRMLASRVKRMISMVASPRCPASPMTCTRSFDLPRTRLVTVSATISGSLYVSTAGCAGSALSSSSSFKPTFMPTPPPSSDVCTTSFTVAWHCRVHSPFKKNRTRGKNAPGASSERCARTKMATPLGFKSSSGSSRSSPEGRAIKTK